MKRSNAQAFVFALVAVFMFLVPWSGLSAKDCGDICKDKGYNRSDCRGSAPWCTNISEPNGGSWGAKKHEGSCTAGNTCWVGHKECWCWHHVDCESSCAKKGHLGSYCLAADTDEIDGKVEIIGMCNDDQMCVCDLD